MTRVSERIKWPNLANHEPIAIWPETYTDTTGTRSGGQEARKLTTLSEGIFPPYQSSCAIRSLRLGFPRWSQRRPKWREQFGADHIAMTQGQILPALWRLSLTGTSRFVFVFLSGEYCVAKRLCKGLFLLWDSYRELEL